MPHGPLAALDKVPPRLLFVTNKGAYCLLYGMG